MVLIKYLTISSANSCDEPSWISENSEEKKNEQTGLLVDEQPRVKAYFPKKRQTKDLPTLFVDENPPSDPYNFDPSPYVGNKRQKKNTKKNFSKKVS